MGKRGITYDMKLTVAQRAALVEEYRAGEKVDYLAAKYQVDRGYPGKLARKRGEPRRERPWRRAGGVDGREHGALIADAKTP